MSGAMQIAGALVVIFAVLGGLTKWVFVPLGKLYKGTSVFLSDWNGESQRPGVERRAGVLEQLQEGRESQAALVEQIVEIRDTQTTTREDITETKNMVTGLHQRQDAVDEALASQQKKLAEELAKRTGEFTKALEDHIHDVDAEFKTVWKNLATRDVHKSIDQFNTAADRLENDRRHFLEEPPLGHTEGDEPHAEDHPE
jgi:hypothetical protein